MFQYELGDKVRDKLTGYEGIAVARSEHLNGCVRYGVQREKLNKDGRPLDAEWFDESQLERIGGKRLKAAQRRTGGPGQPVPRMEPDPR